jgi:hypothetical protein
MSRGAAGHRAAERRHLLILTVAWLAAAAIGTPAGNFPLSDDWSYAHSARTLSYPFTRWLSAEAGVVYVLRTH